MVLYYGPIFCARTFSFVWSRTNFKGINEKTARNSIILSSNISRDIVYQLARDKSITHRLLMFFAMTPGRHRIISPLKSADTLATFTILSQLGIEITESIEAVSFDAGSNQLVWTVHGKDPRDWNLLPKGMLNCQNSGTTLRLLTGILAAIPGMDAVVTGDQSLCRRPMKELIEALRTVGARIDPMPATPVDEKWEVTAPFRIRGASQINPIEHTLSSQSAQVKSSLLLASFTGQNPCILRNYQAEGRDHTERLLSHLGCSVQLDVDREELRFTPRLKELQHQNLSAIVPRDPSALAYIVSAYIVYELPAQMTSGCQTLISFEDVLLNPRRLGFYRILQKANFQIAWKETVPFAGLTNQGAPKDQLISFESVGKITITLEAPKKLKPINYLPGSPEYQEVPPDSLIDEFPVLAWICSHIPGRSVLRGIRGLRSKECDRIRAMTQNLSRDGVKVQEFDDGWEIEGRNENSGTFRQSPQEWDSHSDHRIEMVGALAALSDSESILEKPSVSHAAVSYPDFYSDLRVFEDSFRGNLRAIDLSLEALEWVDKWLKAGVTRRQLVDVYKSELQKISQLRNDQPSSQTQSLQQAACVYKRGALVLRSDHKLESKAQDGSTPIIFVTNPSQFFTPTLWPSTCGLLVDPRLLTHDRLTEFRERGFILPPEFSHGPQQRSADPTPKFILPYSVNEGSKNLISAADLARRMDDVPYIRHWQLIGGGSLLDLGGFVCAQKNYTFTSFPTTLLAMIDAGIGGKTAVDYRGIKNQLGRFSFPCSTVIDPSFLSTLPQEQLASGVGEAIKHAFLAQDQMLLERLYKAPLNQGPKCLSQSDLETLVMIKQAFVDADPFESWGDQTKLNRIFLNLGHTFAHALEFLHRKINEHSISPDQRAGTLPHGLAVLWGIEMMIDFSAALGFLQKGEQQFIATSLRTSTAWSFLEKYRTEIISWTKILGRNRLSSLVHEALSQDKKITSAQILAEVVFKTRDEKLPDLSIQEFPCEALEEFMLSRILP